MTRQYKLFAEETLSSGIDASAVTLPLVSVSTLPTSTGFALVVYNWTDHQDADGNGIPGDDADAECVDITAIAGLNLTISRGLYGTTATTHNAVGKTYRARLVWTNADAESSRSARSLLPYGVDTTGGSSAAGALQNAIDDIAAIGGGELYLPIGDLKIDATITIPDGVRLVGECGLGGVGGSVQGTSIVATAAADPVFKQPASVAWYGVELRNMMIEGTGAGTAIEIDDGGYVHLENLVIDDFPVGVDVFSGAAESLMLSCRRVRYFDAGSATAGFRVRGVLANGARFDQCSAKCGGGVGFDFNGGAGAVFLNCIAEDCTTGIKIAATSAGDADDCIVMGCRFDGCTTGLHVDGTTGNDPRRTVHVGNHFTGCTTDITDTGENSNALRIGTTAPVLVYGAGSPEGSITAVQGSIYQRTDGGNGTAVYAKATTSGNTGWRAVTDAAP